MKPMNKIAFVIFTLILSFATAANATTVVQMDVDDLTAAADAIVVGTVTDIKAELVDGRVFTEITVKVETSLKGEPGQSLVIKHLGGRTAELATYVAGMPHFEKGERALLFLEDKGKTWVTVGLSLGKWTLTGEGDDMKAIAPAAVGMRLVPYDSEQESQPLPASIDVSTLKKKIRNTQTPPSPK